MKTMICFIGLFLTFCALLETSTGLILHDGPHERISRSCLHCKDTTHPENCHKYEHCGDSYCQTEVYYESGRYLFSFGCGDPHHCKREEVHVQNVLGKREPHPPPHHPHEDGTLVCRECCDSTGCEKTSCSHNRLTTPKTTTTTTTTTTTQKPTTTTPKPTVLNPDCRDHETETFKCASLAKFNFCLDNSSLAHSIAHAQCSKFCGFCSPHSLITSPAPVKTTTKQAVAVTQAPATCSDKEVQDFNCAEWKAFGFCSDTSGSGYNIAKERCQKTCGFCQ